MSFKVTKLTVGKGKTVGNEKVAEWIKKYYEIEIEIIDEHDVEIAKASVEGLIDGWLTGQVSNSRKPSEATDFETLFWETKQGSKGEYQQTSKRATNNSDIFQALQRNLKEHAGFWQYRGFKYWFHQQDRDVIDRRKIQA